MTKDGLVPMAAQEEDQQQDPNPENMVPLHQTQRESGILEEEKILQIQNAVRRKMLQDASNQRKLPDRKCVDFQHVILGPSLPLDCQNNLNLATADEIEFWHQIPESQRFFFAVGSHLSAQCLNQEHQSNKHQDRPASLPTPSAQVRYHDHRAKLQQPPHIPQPEPKHYYHQASLSRPALHQSIPAASSHNQNPTHALSLTYIPLVTLFGLLPEELSGANGWFVHHLPLYTQPPLSLCSSSTNILPPKRFFIPYLRHHLELTPSVITRICPADLTHKPCPFDNIYTYDTVTRSWRFGCKMLRLCEVLQQWPHRPPPPLPLPRYSETGVNEQGKRMNAGMLRRRIYRHSVRRGPPTPQQIMKTYPPGDAEHVRHCPHLHGIPKNCRDLMRSRRDGYNRCPFVLDEKVGCVYGHDFEEERLAAYERFKGHVRDSEVEKALSGRVYRNEHGKWVGLDGGGRKGIREVLKEMMEGRVELECFVPEGEEGVEFLRELDSH